ncbi:MAG: hypothetical protein QXE19_01580 [Candidatus Bathyarchaeia archaeon]
MYFKIPVTLGKIEFEFKHLLEKLKLRDRKKYEEMLSEKIELNPKVPGRKEKWKRFKLFFNKFS